MFLIFFTLLLLGFNFQQKVYKNSPKSLSLDELQLSLPHYVLEQRPPSKEEGMYGYCGNGGSMTYHYQAVMVVATPRS